MYTFKKLHGAVTLKYKYILYNTIIIDDEINFTVFTVKRGTFYV